MKKRHEGIDLLRCTAMLMIIVLHIMNHGGILRTAVVGTTSYHGAWLMESAAYCAVNCYALITGYICIKRSIATAGSSRCGCRSRSTP